ncbi:lysoplasmalogenase [Paenibacillus endoradicis]|uniref:lysoplasmalogenase n=1 Tax=Paenibacillus endoradicis TaxID=2972487 RepID=UPI0021595769|nr:lysoplasmalogenase [Paenibacillus endoradicis]MCR8659585.1 lysoplasmalogenase [Paenibacillus endoradicis]
MKEVVIIKNIRDWLLPIVIIFMSSLYIFVWDSMIFKLIPMVLIITFGCMQLPKKKELHHYLVILGLLFCMLGDYTLQWFIIGLFSFLIGHIFYIFAFNLRRSKGIRNKSIGFIISAYAIIMAIIMVMSLIDGQKGGLIVPVILYIVVISLMVWTAWLTKNIWIMIGSLCFMVSDSILAWNMFVASIDIASLLIMSTYYGAQFCFARSLRTPMTSSSAYE